MTAEKPTKDEIDTYHELILNQKLLQDHGGQKYFEISDLNFLDMDDCADIANDMEYTLASLQRKQYAKKYPEFRKMAKEIAIRSKYRNS
ncbi:MAG: hypothetical protein HOD92_13790 [Deltaproteobacteria bacterium]|jgi:hypothetical protein|nr:hypothetical protein [Deltaproteobacteria bacterium]